MKLSRRKFLHATAAGLVFVAASDMARAQAYPSRPITMIVPFPPGGLTDVLGRVLAAGMQAALGQTVVVENVGGASGSIGTGRVARAAPDRVHRGAGYMEHPRGERRHLQARLRRGEGFCAGRAVRGRPAGAVGKKIRTG